MIAGVLCLAWTWGAITSTTRNWELEQRLVNKKRELTLLQLEIETIELENRYYASEEYQELSAREKQNKMTEGEFMVLLPENTDYAKHKDAIINADEPEEEEEKTNFEQWISFVFGS